MGCEGVMGVKGDPQNSRGPTQCEVRPLPDDVWVCAGLVGVRNEKRAVGFGDRDCKALLTGPCRHVRSVGGECCCCVGDVRRQMLLP